MSDAEKITELRQELTKLNEVLHRKNVELDALHMVWCDGGCVNGVHRWTEDPITEEVVATAERNTARLRRWYTNAKYRLDRLERDPTRDEYFREYSTKLSKKIAEP